MPFYFRRSISAGPFRFNLSKSGVGMSVGVRGLRIGTGPRGHYIRAGLGGIYYQQSLGGHVRRARQTPVPRHIPASGNYPPGQPSGGRAAYDVTMVEIESSDLIELQDESFATLLDDLNGRSSRLPLSPFILLPFLVGVLASAAIELRGAAAALSVLSVLAFIVGLVLDRARRRSVIMYDIEPDLQDRYEAMIGAFDALVACHGRWHIPSAGLVRGSNQRKHHAGAHSVVDRKDTALGYGLPPNIKSNVKPPVLSAGRQRLYFLPDIVLVEGRRGFGAVTYDDLDTGVQISNFIETDRAPRDAELVSHTWQYPNRDGGPDRRFARNRQLPVYRYGALALQSASGLMEAFEFSKLQPTIDFARSLEQLRPE